MRVLVSQQKTKKMEKKLKKEKCPICKRIKCICDTPVVVINLRSTTYTKRKAIIVGKTRHEWTAQELADDPMFN